MPHARQPATPARTRYGTHRGAAAMTLYISRHATAATPNTSARPVRPEPVLMAERVDLPRVDPPLFNHVWQRLFEQTMRKEGHR
ncbi:multiple cyclophane-containing RiPP AmcA [Micromonospora sonchi]|uniref:multiple cyclophane-containing RiPP AmcA n=1 Tax=Micromonospora sonchi TaxID=1763543 RepID=UPI003571747B